MWVDPWEDLLEENVATISVFLENPMDRGAWRAVVHRVAKNLTWLKWLSMHRDLSLDTVSTVLTLLEDFVLKRINYHLFQGYFKAKSFFLFKNLLLKILVHLNLLGRAVCLNLRLKIGFLGHYVSLKLAMLSARDTHSSHPLTTFNVCFQEHLLRIA